MAQNAAAARTGFGPHPQSDPLDCQDELVCSLVAGTLWDQSALRFSGICQEQLFAFAASRWPGMAIEPLLFRRDGELVGGCLVMKKLLPAGRLTGHLAGFSGFAVIKWGPVLADGADADAEAIYRAMAAELVARYVRSEGLFMTILPRATPARFNPGSAILDELGFSHGSSLPYPNRYFVRIGLEPAELKASFGQKWRYHLKKSNQNGLTFNRSEPKDLPLFNALYATMTDRKRFADYSAFSTLDVLFANDEPGLRPELFMVRHKGEPVAGAVIFTAGDTAVYLYGATSNEALPLRAGYFIQGEIIKWLGENTDVGWYDLGGTDGHEGLARFKLGMTGKAGQIQPVPPVMHFAPNPWAGVLGTGIYRVRDFKSNLMRRIHAFGAGR